MQCNDAHLVVTVDGICPFKSNESIWSMWPIMLLKYDFPPWLCTKNFFCNVGIANS